MATCLLSPTQRVVIIRNIPPIEAILHAIDLIHIRGDAKDALSLLAVEEQHLHYKFGQVNSNLHTYFEMAWTYMLSQCGLNPGQLAEGKLILLQLHNLG